MKTSVAVRSASFILSVFLLAAPSTSQAQNLFVANDGNHTVEEFNSLGAGTVFANTAANFPTGLAFDGAGNLYVALAGNNTVERFSFSGSVLSSNGTVFANSGLDGPMSLAFDKNGNLYAANYLNNTIEEFGTNGVGTVFANSGLSNPQGLAFEPVPEPATWAMVALGIGGVFGGRRLRRRKP